MTCGWEMRRCITCGEITRRRWYDQPVCYACAGVRVSASEDGDER